jgi:hypothetical protein
MQAKNVNTRINAIDDGVPCLHYGAADCDRALRCSDRIRKGYCHN